MACECSIQNAHFSTTNADSSSNSATSPDATNTEEVPNRNWKLDVRYEAKRME